MTTSFAIALTAVALLLSAGCASTLGDAGSANPRMRMDNALVGEWSGELETWTRYSLLLTVTRADEFV